MSLAPHSGKEPELGLYLNVKENYENGGGQGN